VALNWTKEDGKQKPRAFGDRRKIDRHGKLLIFR
jgi:hypothetical protein